MFYQVLLLSRPSESPLFAMTLASNEDWEEYIKAVCDTGPRWEAWYIKRPLEFSVLSFDARYYGALVLLSCGRLILMTPKRCMTRLSKSYATHLQRRGSKPTLERSRSTQALMLMAPLYPKKSKLRLTMGWMMARPHHKGP